jgi:hypothetical protein
VIGYFAATAGTGAIMVAVLLWLLRPTSGVTAVVEELTEEVEADPIDTYLAEREAGAVVVLPPPIHYACADAYFDREPSKMCPDCATNLAGAPR